MSPESVFEIPAHVIARRIGGEIVIMELERGTYFGLDPVGARVWDLVGEGRTLGAVCAVMLEEYEVDEAQLEQDIRELVQDLRQRGLLVERRSGRS